MAVLAEYLYQKLMKKPSTIKDLSAAVTSLTAAAKAAAASFTSSSEAEALSYTPCADAMASFSAARVPTAYCPGSEPSFTVAAKAVAASIPALRVVLELLFPLTVTVTETSCLLSF